MKQLALLAVVIAVSAIIGFLIYLGLTRSPLAREVSILFYRGLILCGCAALLLAVVLTFAATRWGWLDPPTIVAAVAVSLSFNICFLVLLPVTVDRSISVFLLAQVAQHEGADAGQLQQLFVSRYVGDMRQIDRRITEQSESGNIEVVNGKVRLTARGRRFLSFSRTLAWLFHTDPRFVGLERPLSRSR